MKQDWYNRYMNAKKLYTFLCSNKIILFYVTNCFRYFDDIFEKSGFSKLADQYGSFFTHAGSPRAKMFARDQSKVTDIDSLIHLMR